MSLNDDEIQRPTTARVHGNRVRVLKTGCVTLALLLTFPADTEIVDPTPMSDSDHSRSGLWHSYSILEQKAAHFVLFKKLNSQPIQLIVDF